MPRSLVSSSCGSSAFIQVLECEMSHAKAAIRGRLTSVLSSRYIDGVVGSEVVTTRIAVDATLKPHSDISLGGSQRGNNIRDILLGGN
jgi:hypothetical protein